MKRWFNPVVADIPGVINDAFDGFILGGCLGMGSDREVYVYKPDPTKVVKIELGNGNFQNVAEHHVWHIAAVENKHWLKGYLAKVFQISSYGCWLIMERTYTPPKHYKWPERMPSALADMKRGNFGLNHRGRLVCHDYGMHFLLDNGLSKRMRKADWWDE